MYGVRITIGYAPANIIWDELDYRLGVCCALNTYNQNSSTIFTLTFFKT